MAAVWGFPGKDVARRPPVSFLVQRFGAPSALILQPDRDRLPQIPARRLPGWRLAPTWRNAPARLSGRGRRFKLRNEANWGLGQSCGTKPIWRSGRTVGMGCHICFPAGIWLLGPCRGREKPVPFSSRGGIQAATSAFRTCSTDESGVGCPRAAPGAGRGCETRRFPAGERRFFILRLAGGLGGGWVSGA